MPDNDKYHYPQPAPSAPLGPTPMVMTACDPWANRTAGMRCKTCLYCALKCGASIPPMTAREVGGTDPRGRIGRCRRHAPTMNGYPVIFETDWCGDHKLDETKL